MLLENISTKQLLSELVNRVDPDPDPVVGAILPALKAQILVAGAIQDLQEEIIDLTRKNKIQYDRLNKMGMLEEENERRLINLEIADKHITTLKKHIKLLKKKLKKANKKNFKKLTTDLFAGGTGGGKTELAESFADNVARQLDKLIKPPIDYSSRGPRPKSKKK